jgi:hypothetical protein
MRKVPSTRQLALLLVSLSAWDDEADDPLTYEWALLALLDPDVRTAAVRAWDAARSVAAESVRLLRGLGTHQCAGVGRQGGWSERRAWS